VESLLPGKHDYAGVLAQAFGTIRQTFKDFYKLRAEESCNCHCLLHESEELGCPLADDVWSLYTGGSTDQHIVLHAAGIPCDDMTAMGQRAGESGDTQKVHGMFTEERVWKQEDLLLYECAPSWSTAQDAASLEATHQGLESLIHAPHFGDVQSRTRKLCTFFRKETATSSD